MKTTLIALVSVLAATVAHADQASLRAKIAAFQKQSADLQAQMLQIEKIAVKCDTFKEEVESKLIPKSKAARDQLARLTKEVAALAHAPNAAAAEKSLSETGAELRDAVQQTSNEEQVANVKFVVSCALPGNPNAEKKVDKALAGLQNLLKIHKALEAEL